MTHPIIWVLVGERTGDNNQVLALAEALGLPFEVKQLHYNKLRAFSEWLGPSRVTLDGPSKAELHAPWPDLIIAIGRRSVPVARWIRKQSGGRTRIVLIGNPRQSPRLFDLIITTRQYPVPPGDNVLLLPVALNRHPDPPRPDVREEEWLSSLPRPRRLVAIGGKTKYWTLCVETVLQKVHLLLAKGDGSLIIVTSRRTDQRIIEAVRGAIDGTSARLVDGPFPRFAMLLGDADEIFVTGDSVSMISEAILTGKPVGIVPLHLDSKGKRRLGPRPHVSGANVHRRDLRRFWTYVTEHGLAGSVEQPAAGNVGNPNQSAAAAVRALLEKAPKPSHPR